MGHFKVNEKPTKKNTKTILQRSAISNDTDITDNNDPIDKKLSQKADHFPPDLSLTKNPSTSEKFNDSENHILQMQFFHRTYTSAIKQPFRILIFDPSFFEYASDFKDFFLLPDNRLIFETILNYHKRDLVLKIVQKLDNTNSCPFVKSHVATASPFLLNYYHFFFENVA